MAALPGRRALAALAAAAVAVAGASARADGPATGAIAGHVTATSGRVCVSVLDASGQEVARAPTDDAGAYTVSGVPAGTWTVEFLPDLGCQGRVTNEAFQFASGRGTRASADPVVVTAGATTGGIDATLALAASIEGTVRDAAGHVLPGVCAVLEDPAGQAVVRDLTNPDGEYRLLQLPAGTFVVHFVDDGCVGAPASHTAATSLPLTLEPGAAWGGLDARLADVPAGGGGGSAAGGGSGSAGPAPGGGPAPGTASGGTPTGLPGAGAPTPAPKALVALLAPPSGGYRLDARHRIALRLLCQRGGARCTGRVVLSWLRAKGHRTPAGKLALRLPADGRTHVVRVGLRGHGRRLRLQLYLNGRARPVVTATLAHIS